MHARPPNPPSWQGDRLSAVPPRGLNTYLFQFQMQFILLVVFFIARWQKSRLDIGVWHEVTWATSNRAIRIEDPGSTFPRTVSIILFSSWSLLTPFLFSR